MADRGEQIYNSVLDFIRDNAGENRNLCVEVAEQILNRTGHIPIVSNIARGAGYCSYYARLSEAVGVKKLWDHVVDRFSGKGSDTHRILGLASLYLFVDEPAADRIEQCVDRAVETARPLLRDERSVDRALIISMMMNLMQNLDRLLQTIESSIQNMVPIIEQQFMDYNFHMRGIPDLILEDRKNQKAIVVDWKTGRESPSQYESAQVICYSLMEAKRLAYNREESLNAVLGNLNENQIRNVRVLPVIIRPPMLRGILPPHPVLRDDADNLRESYEQFRKIVYDVCIEAEHLTILITNQIKLTGVSPSLCEVDVPFHDGMVRRLNITRQTPRQLRHGDPQHQNRYPCVGRNGAPFCNLIRSCNFYFGEFGEQNNYDRIMWKLRFGIFDNKEKDLLTYRALHEIFSHYPKEAIAEALRRGEGIKITLGQVPFFDSSLKSRMLVSRGSDSSNFRVDVLDRIDPDPADDYALLGVRTTREYENDLDRFTVINEGKPVLVTSVDANNPLLSINAFGRIDDIEILNDQQLVYRIGTPSKVLNYQMILFREYLRLKAGLNRNVFVFETNVDLTQMELNSIDALHERIGAETENGNLDQSWIEELNHELQQTNDAASEQSDEPTIEQLLRDIIERGSSRGSR